MKGAQNRNRIARLRRGGDSSLEREKDEDSLFGNKNTISSKTVAQKSEIQVVDPFAKFDDITHLDLDTKGKNLFGNNENTQQSRPKPAVMEKKKEEDIDDLFGGNFGFKPNNGGFQKKSFLGNDLSSLLEGTSEKPKEVKNDLSSILERGGGTEVEKIERGPDNRRMRMNLNQKDKGNRFDSKERVICWKKYLILIFLGKEFGC